jgi:Flp pilus assembly protein TadG
MCLRKLIRSEIGGPIIELAMSLPLLVLVFAVTVDFARVFHQSIALMDAARAGAQWGSYSTVRSTQTANIQSAATSATSLSGVTAAASRSCQCASDAGTFSPTSPANDCSSAEATACPGSHRVITVSVTTSKSFSPLMGNVPGLPSSISLSRTATLRVVN